MSKPFLVIIIAIVLLIDSVAASRDLIAKATADGKRKGRNRINRADFRAKGGVRRALGNSTITKLAKRAKLRGRVDQLVEALDTDEDLVSRQHWNSYVLLHVLSHREHSPFEVVDCSNGMMHAPISRNGTLRVPFGICCSQKLQEHSHCCCSSAAGLNRYEWQLWRTTSSV